MVGQRAEATRASSKRRSPESSHRGSPPSTPTADVVELIARRDSWRATNVSLARISPTPSQGESHGDFPSSAAALSGREGETPRPASTSPDSIETSTEELLRFHDELLQIREARQAKATASEAILADTSPPATSSPVHTHPSSSPILCIPLASPILISQPTCKPMVAELGKHARDTFAFPIDPSPKEL